MADAAISFAVEKLGDALIHKVNFLKGVEDQVRWLKDELQSMQCFLKDASEKQGHDERIRQWIRDVREVAQDAEDAIEMFTLKVDKPTRKRDLARKWAGFPTHVSHLNRVGKEIESARSRLDEVGKRRERYGIRNLGEAGMEPSSEFVELRRRMAARFRKDKDVVGLNEDADLLLRKLGWVASANQHSPRKYTTTRPLLMDGCHGLPLAITVAGGLLESHEESKSGWERVLKQIKNYDSETSEIGKNVSAILELSYHNLPSHIKPCFLCLAFFKEDAVFRAKRLMHIWVALGFVQVQEGGTESVEERAMSYLDELINRNIVHVKDMKTDDKVKNCHVHDLLRELSIKKAKEEIGFESLISEDEGSSSSSSYKPRHCVVRGMEKLLVKIDTSNQKRHLRSLFLNVEYPKKSDPYFINPSYWKRFELLRILDIEGSVLFRLPSEIRALIGIRYLRLTGHEGRLALPSWLDVLKNLEVLDIADCAWVTFPDVIWKMDSLRHFYMNHRYISFSDSMEKSSWHNLETLKYIRSDDVIFLIQSSGPRLRKLGIEMVDWGSGVAEIGRSLEEKAVQVLHLRWKGQRDVGEIPNPNSLGNLTKLKLQGEMNWCPSADKFPQNITHLTLSWSFISRNDPMQELGKLPNLSVLKLDHALSSTHSQRMEVLHDSFPMLKVLYLRNMNWLQNVEIEEGGMPELQQLQIHECPKLQTEDLRERIRPAEIVIFAH